MAEFSMKIAGHTARITTLFASTPHYFSKYLTDDPAEFSICVEPEDLVFEQDFALEEAREEGFKPRIFPDPFLERAAIQRKFYAQLIHHRVLLVHGSAIAVDGQGYLFVAKSGTGKSTHTRLWRQLLEQRAVMINDDKPFLAFRPEGILLCGSPWSGKHGLDSDLAVPLRGICLLQRGSRDAIEPLSPEEGRGYLQTHSCPPQAEAMPIFADLVDALATAVPLWRMDCTKELRAAQVAFGAMSGENREA